MFSHIPFEDHFNNLLLLFANLRDTSKDHPPCHLSCYQTAHDLKAHRLTTNLLLCNNAHIHSLQPANCFSHSTPHPCAQPPAKRTLLEISLQITLCLLNPHGRRKTPILSRAHSNRAYQTHI